MRAAILITTLGVLIALYSQYVLLLIAGAYVLHGLLFKAWALIRPRPAGDIAHQAEVEQQ